MRVMKTIKRVVYLEAQSGRLAALLLLLGVFASSATVGAQSIYETYVVSTLAGSAGNPGTADGTGSAARLNQPIGTAVDNSGNVYVADTDNYIIRKITPTGNVTTFAGLAG